MIDEPRDSPACCVLIGTGARFPEHWRVFERVCELAACHGIVIGPEESTYEIHRQSPGVGRPNSGSSVVRLQTLPSLPALVLAVRLARRFRRLAPQAIVLTPEAYDRWGLATLAALSVVQRDVPVVALVMENRVRLPGGLKGAIIRRLLRRIDVLAAPAEPTVRSYVEAGLPASTRTIELVAAVEEPRDVAPADLGLSAEFRIAYVGRLVEEKGVQVLVDAVERVPGCGAVLVGPGSLEGTLRRRVDEAGLAGRVKLFGLGSRDEIWGILKACDALVLLSQSRPSWTEQFGYVLAEAMACGRPLIGSTSGAIPQVIGPAGLIVEEGSVEATADAIRSLARDAGLRTKLGSASRERYLQHFTTDACARKVAAAAGLIEDQVDV